MNCKDCEKLKEALEEMCYQFGYQFGNPCRLGTGGLSALETAFDLLGWEDPHPTPEQECDELGCHEYATCGFPSPNGYRRTCGEHYRKANP